MSKQIRLTQGKTAIVDDEDFERVNQYRWQTLPTHGNLYAIRTIDGTTQYMHRFILEIPKGLQCDHRDGNGLNNVKSNLRAVTHSQNMKNKKLCKKNTSGYKGVSQTGTKWVAAIAINNKSIRLGTFSNKIDAAIAYNNAAIQYYGEFASLNEIK